MNSKNIITSLSNSQVKHLMMLQTKSKIRNERAEFIIEGIKLYNEAREDGVIVKTYISESFYSEIKESIEFDYEIIKDSIFKEISDTISPQGIMAIVKMPKNEISDILGIDKKNKLKILLLENIRDPGNLGTIIRTAEGAGLSGIIINNASVDLYNPKVIRSTMGSIFRVPIYITNDLVNTINYLKQKEVYILAAHLDGKPYCEDIVRANRSAVLIGNESKGLSDNIISLADSLIKIPMAGKVESLNAAVAASILMYEMVK